MNLIEILYKKLDWIMIVYLLFLIEATHIILHLGVLLRLYLMPQNVLEQRKWYFVIDCMTPVISCIYVGNYPFIIFLHTEAHLYYISNWNISYYCKRIIRWSSRNYQGSVYTWDMLLTMFDILSHCYVLVLLFTTL